ncbi:SRPBCC family protein [Halalkalicoccus sp. NIPERK01]|uniref:SRPBCC family protein n=1 Tax=Halalkalicoccus sp. NIPERK01 TaxID=3053469 RepID=UPI00256F0F24|nr:SRPBCC family protein [Halalkalicoccus sp. NIPERK01]MDL5361080.1 SRPBCC family protein [Halalkalicoccus sp. NIPERK01]
MATYERETYVNAPLDDVWEFHSRVEGLEALTPNWMGLAIRGVRGPDGERDPEVLEAGAEIDMVLRPLGSPGESWISVITDRSESDERALFRDEMRDGPFARWSHVHQFRREGEGTRIRDTVHYELPGVCRAASPLAVVGFEPMFRYRHRKTKELLEG